MSKERNLGLYKIELNNMGDYIEISTAYTGLFDSFVETYKQIADAAKALPEKYREIEAVHVIPGHENKTVEKIRANVKFCEESVEKIERVFGQGTLKKYFRDHYEKLPDFMPGTECFIDFFEQIAPVLERLFGRKINEGYKKRIKSMGQHISF